MRIAAANGPPPFSDPHAESQAFDGHLQIDYVSDDEDDPMSRTVLHPVLPGSLPPSYLTQMGQSIFSVVQVTLGQVADVAKKIEDRTHIGHFATRLFWSSVGLAGQAVEQAKEYVHGKNGHSES